MTDKLTCPYCEGRFDLEMVEMGEHFQERFQIAARLGRAWSVANEYVDAFAQKPGARINVKKRVRHLKEVLKLWEKGLFELDGKRYRARQDAILAAMTQVCELEKTGFQNHNYLKKVLTQTAERVSSEGMTAKEEAKRHEGESRVESRESRVESPEERPKTLEEFKKERGIERVVGGFLKGME